MHIQYSPERVQRKGWKMDYSKYFIRTTLSIPQRGCRGGAGKWQGYSKYFHIMHI